MATFHGDRKENDASKKTTTKKTRLVAEVPQNEEIEPLV